jgi:hypothetical protein
VIDHDRLFKELLSSAAAATPSTGATARVPAKGRALG